MSEYALSENAVRKLAEDHRRLEQLYFNLRSQVAARPAWDLPEPPLMVFNNNAAAIPAFGLIGCASDSLTGLRPIIIGDQPTGSSAQAILVNGPDPIKPNGTGPVQRGPIVQFLYDSSATPAANDVWGPKSGQWTATKNGPNVLTAIGLLNSTNKYALGMLGKPVAGTVRIFGTLATSISSDPTSCNVSRATNGPSPGATVDVYQPSSSFFTGNSGARYEATFDSVLSQFVFDWVDECSGS